MLNLIADYEKEIDVALTCHVCGKELEIGNSRRCHRCNNLICNECLAHSETKPTCVNCFQQPKEEKELTASVHVVPSEIPCKAILPIDKLSDLPRWSFLAFIILMLGIFSVIVVYPGVQAKQLSSVIEGPSLYEARKAAEKLVEIGSGAALKELAAVAMYGKTEQARGVAIQALGTFQDSGVMDYLNVIADDSYLSDSLRARVEEAIVSQRVLETKGK